MSFDPSAGCSRGGAGDGGEQPERSRGCAWVPQVQPPAGAELSLCLGAVPPAGRNHIAGAAGSGEDIIDPTAGIPEE